MKKGQLLSQPFFYIFAIIVIGLILIFGFTYVNKILKTGCQVEILSFVGDVQAKINEVYSLSYGSSFECFVVRSAGQSDSRCELVLPNNIRGACFVDTTKGYDADDIVFSDTKDLVVKLGASANKNLFFSTLKDSSCAAEPVMIKKATTNGVICVDLTKNKSFIIENNGNIVEIKKV
ncbi:hypothetical protein J4230_04390 [Candidatus Woesearchaeota archaeon]|nr:hypothetical protein [Candidatus Woesearchaeota archaeon]